MRSSSQGCPSLLKLTGTRMESAAGEQGGGGRMMPDGSTGGGVCEEGGFGVTGT